MPVYEGSIIRLRMYQRLQGQTVLNVNHFIVNTVADGAAGLAGFVQAAALEFYAAWTPNQSDKLTYVRAELDEVNGIDFGQYSFAPNMTGDLSGDELPPFNAAAIRLNRMTKVTRNGSMRLAGLVEGQQTNGQFVGAPYVALQTAADTWFNTFHVWEDPLVPGRELTATHIIWGGNDPGYPLGRYSLIGTVQVSPYVTTQNTRKYRAVEGA